MTLSPTTVTLAVLALAAALLVAAALVDARIFRIPNAISLVLLILFPVYVAVSPVRIPWIHHVVVFLLVLGVGYALYRYKYAGAGDIKLIAVMALWTGPDRVGEFLFITAMAGGALAVALAVLNFVRNRRRKAGEAAQPIRKIPMPYGVAIAVGGLCSLSLLTHPLLIPS